MELKSLFGLPLEVISNLADSSEHLSPAEPLNEKMVFVGGRYQEKHDDIFRLFYLNVTETTKLNSQAYVIWNLLVTVLTIAIVLCQVGFALLYSGASRKYSVVTPFVTNTLNLGITAVAFWAVGYAVARSEGFMALGYNDWFAHDAGSAVSVDWFLYFSLALTTVNIASSGGLERCPLWISSLVSVTLAGIVFPFIIRWTWHYSGWMLKYTLGLGVQYQDVGGSGPIHAVGGAAALVINLILGPRDEKMQRKGRRALVYDVEGHSVPLEMLGSYVVFICILCTNVVRGISSYLGTDPSAAVGRGLMNTVISSAVCCLVTLLLSFLLKRIMGVWKFHWLFSRMVINSVLMGAVSVSGGSTMYSQWTCAIIGMLAAIGYILWAVVLGFTKVDDVTGSIAVHLGGGILGAVCVDLFKKDTGLLFSENIELVGMGLLWNLVCVLSMIVVTMVVVGLVMMVPSMLDKAPLSTAQLLQGMDYLLLKQEGYPNGHIISMYNADAIEDRETFSDSHTASPASQQPFAYQYGPAHAYNNDLMFPQADWVSQGNGFPATAYTSGSSLPEVYRDLPYQRDLTFQNTPVADRHVWFGGENLQPDLPLTPLPDDPYEQRLQFF